MGEAGEVQGAALASQADSELDLSLHTGKKTKRCGGGGQTTQYITAFGFL